MARFKVSLPMEMKEQLQGMVAVIEYPYWNYDDPDWSDENDGPVDSANQFMIKGDTIFADGAYFDLESDAPAGEDDVDDNWIKLVDIEWEDVSLGGEDSEYENIGDVYSRIANKIIHSYFRENGDLRYCYENGADVDVTLYVGGEAEYFENVEVD